MGYALANIMEELIFDAMPAIARPAYRHSVPRAPLDILLVEDDASDMMLTEEALEAVNIEYELHTLDNGADVLPYLRRQGKYTDERRPDLVLLDLGLPAQDGFEVLAEMALQSERFRDMPIVILTGDTQSSFLKKSYGLNISAYVTKPCSPEKMNAIFNAVRGSDR